MGERFLQPVVTLEYPGGQKGPETPESEVRRSRARERPLASPRGLRAAARAQRSRWACLAGRSRGAPPEARPRGVVLGWRYLSNSTCLVRPRVFSAALLV